MCRNHRKAVSPLKFFMLHFSYSISIPLFCIHWSY
uniref:Uncharacterized protein n=1 Tax=Arundo donax TaxID=35708 RepID=A0A0A8Z7N4_ARUDO